MVDYTMGFSPERVFSKRDLIKATAATAGTLLALKLNAKEALASSSVEAERLTSYLRNPETDEKTFKFIEFASRFTVDDIGYRISNSWKSNKDGLWRCAWQGILLKDDPTHGIIPENSLDDFLKPYDAYLEAVYQIPPHQDWNDSSNGDINAAFENRIKHFGIGPEVENWIREKRARFETGLPTSREEDYGPFKNTRLQRYVVQRLPDGIIRRVLVGDIVKEVGRSVPGEKIIPDEALLLQPDLGTGGGVEINPQNISIYREVLDKYVAGGEFMDASTLLGRLFVTEKGARIIVPLNFIFKFKEAQNQAQWKEIIKAAVSGENVILDPDGAVIMRKFATNQNIDVVYSIRGGEKKLVNSVGVGFSPMKYRWSFNMGLVSTDGFRITHKFIKDSHTWQEFDNYILTGTPQQLIEKSLIDFLYTDTITTPTQTYTNLLELNPTDVETYLRNKSDIGLKSFQILKNAKGEPAFIVQTGGRWGLKPEGENITNAKKAVDRLNQIDPDIVAIMTRRFGLRALTGDVLNGSFVPGSFNYEASAAYDPNLGAIKFNEKTRSRPAGYLDVIAALIEESAGIFSARHTISVNGKPVIKGSIEFLSIHPGLHKALFNENWVETHRDQLSSIEYNILISYARNSIDFYKKLISETT